MKNRIALLGSALVLSFAACGGDESSNLNAPTASSSGGSSSSSSSSSSSGGMTSSSGGGMDASTDSGPTTDAAVEAGLTMSFFATSTGSGANGGNLGGLAGADTKCQTLAAAKGLGGKTWKAYLSIEGTNAKDRIGAGPWYNQKLKMVAANVNALHANNFDIPVADIFDENGVAVPLNEHDILTGTKKDGTAEGSTCNGWTSNNNNQQAHVGHTDASGAGSGNWNDAHDVNCSQGALMGANGAGRLYCFASN